MTLFLAAAKRDAARKVMAKPVVAAARLVAAAISQKKANLILISVCAGAALG